ncbi:hypothetical protein [Pseudonocardia sp.]|jgi:hypothetical protein|uniref:hypothetical protein n=1 Tax=Pseudonocardia sp. TaxID=60912 RepID=UPI002DAAB37A|nr:hypothetical protein [Pseudonocardia sp.]
MTSARVIDPSSVRVAGRRVATVVPDLVMLVGVALAASAAFLLVHRALIDDAYITMTYARNLAFHLHWGLITDETANSATSPLNVILLGAITFVLRNAQIAVGVLFVASVVLATRWLTTLTTLLGLSRATPYLGVALLLLNPLLLSTVGLESYLAATLVIGLLRFGAEGRSIAFGVVSGLAFLTRPDLAVVVLIAAVGFPGIRRRVVRAFAVAVLVAGPWHLWAWFALGSALPDTLIMKAGSPTWSGFGFWDGALMYWGGAPIVTALAFLPVLLGAAALLAVLVARLFGHRDAAHRTAAVAGVGAGAHYLAYCVLSTPPYHWYYAPLISGMTVCAVLVLGRVLAHRREVRLPVLAAVGFVVAVVLGFAMAWFDVDHGTPWQRAPISTNWATAAQYERIGDDLRGIVGAGTVESPGEIGTLAYYCDCRIVDPFSDRGRVLGAIAAREEQSGWLARTLIRLNYLHLDRTQQPRPVDARLVFQRGETPVGALQWPAYQWADGPGRMILLPGAG